MRVFFDNAQMTSTRGKNKEVRYDLQASSVLRSHQVLTSSVHYQSTHARSDGIYLYIVMIWVISLKIRIVFIFVVMISASRTLQLITSFVQTPLDQSKRAFNSVHYIVL